MREFLDYFKFYLFILWVLDFIVSWFQVFFVFWIFLLLKHLLFHSFLLVLCFFSLIIYYFQSSNFLIRNGVFLFLPKKTRFHFVVLLISLFVFAILCIFLLNFQHFFVKSQANSLTLLIFLMNFLHFISIISNHFLNSIHPFSNFKLVILNLKFLLQN